MRVLQLRDGGAEPLRLDLHRQLSVVRGLRPQERARVAEALEGLPRGRFSGLEEGLVEVHGIHFRLDDETLSLLDLSEELEVVIRADDLPGHDREATDAAARRAEAEEERKVAKRQLSRARTALTKLEQRQEKIEADLDQLKSDDDAAEVARADLARRQEQARDELKQHQEQLDAATAELERATQEQQRVADARTTAAGAVEEARETGRRAVERRAGILANLEQARAGVDPEAPELHERAQARLAELEAALVAQAEAEAPDPAAAEAAAEQVRRRARYVEINRLLLALPETDVTPVREAARAARAHDDQEPVEVPEAIELADRWGAFEEQGEVDEAPGQAEVEEARARLEAAKAALAEREGDPSSRFGAEDVRKLEVAHAKVLEAQQRAEGRFAGGRAQRRLASARQAEREILDRLGFNTFADFMMSSPSVATAEDGDAELEAARAAVGAARVELRALLERTSDPSAEARRTERAELAAATAALLGDADGPDVEQRLRDLRQAPDAAPLVADLRSALRAVGVALADEDELDRMTLVALAEAWLEEQKSADEERQALAAELEALGDVEEEQGSGEGADVTAAMEARRREAELDEGRGAVDATAAREAAHHQAVAHVAELEATLAAAEEDERTAAEMLAEREAEVARHDEAVTAAGEAVEATGNTRLQALATVDQAAAALSALDEGPKKAPAEEVAKRTAKLTSDLEDVIARRSAAEAEVRLLEVRVAAADERVTAEQEAEQAAIDSRPQTEAEVEAQVDEIEWFLLTKLAAQRSVGLAGSVPLVLDDPFGDLPSDGTRRLVEHLTRLAPTVQVVLFTDDGELAAWAESAGDDRAALVHALRPGS